MTRCAVDAGVVQFEPVTVERPLWGNAADVKRIFGMTYAILKKLTKQGRIRSWKLGESKQSARLYRISDIDELLLSEATGQPPVYCRPQALTSPSLPPPSSPTCQGHSFSRRPRPAQVNGQPRPRSGSHALTGATDPPLFHHACQGSPFSLDGGFPCE